MSKTQNFSAVQKCGAALFFVADRRSLGFVFQDATLMPWTDIADNVYLPLRLREPVFQRFKSNQTRAALSRPVSAVPGAVAGTRVDARRPTVDSQP